MLVFRLQKLSERKVRIKLHCWNTADSTPTLKKRKKLKENIYKTPSWTSLLQSTRCLTFSAADVPPAGAACHRAARLRGSPPATLMPVFGTLVSLSRTQYSVIVSSLFRNTAASECFSQAPTMTLLLWGFAVNINIYLLSEQLGASWVDSTLFYSLQIKWLDVLLLLIVCCLSFIFPSSRITTTFGVHSRAALFDFSHQNSF